MRFSRDGRLVYFDNEQERRDYVRLCRIAALKDPNFWGMMTLPLLPLLPGLILAAIYFWLKYSG
jgi:hypothetical protein